MIGLWSDQSARRPAAHADQRVVHWTWQDAPVANQFNLEGKNVRDVLCTLLEVDISSLPQNIEHQDRTLPHVQPVFLHGTSSKTAYHLSILLPTR
jgi:hypothetical protein